MAIPMDWQVKANATAGVATATKAAVAKNRHTLVHVAASYSDPAVSGLLTISVNGTAVWEQMIHGADAFTVEFLAAKNGAVAASLASGGAGKVGYVNIAGTTE